MEHDEMLHQEIYNGVSNLLKQRNDIGRYRLLDLGLAMRTIWRPA